MNYAKLRIVDRRVGDRHHGGYDRSAVRIEVVDHAGEVVACLAASKWWMSGDAGGLPKCGIELIAADVEIQSR